jgi:hypothetical protein
MRLLLPLFIFACGSSSSTPPTNAPPTTAVADTAGSAGSAAPTTPTTQPAAASATEEPCEADTTDVPDGLHDRFSFQDPKTDLWGFKTKAGKVAIKPTYESVYPFRAGGIAAVIDGKTPFAFIDPSGKVIAKAYAFDNGPDYFQEGLARIVGPDGKVGFIDDKGVIAISPRFEKAFQFCHGKVEVEQAGKQLIVDRAGAPVAR